ncbi:pseudaminic acid synthase [Fundidesulfovibrio butyratiphilus]
MKDSQGTFAIAGRPIGPGHPVYVVAEISANHRQDKERAAELIRVAKECGADAVKLQTYTPDTITLDCDTLPFRISGTLWDGRTLHELYGEAFTPWEWQPELKRLADDLAIPLFSTPFDETAVDFLETLDVPAYKVASFELVDIPLLRKIGNTGKPVIASTGMATLAEIDEAVRTLRGAGCPDLCLLRCVSAYPSPANEMHLRTIPHMAEAFGVVSGLSDHTLGIAVPVAATAVGARVIEKHFCLRRADGGPDAAFSLEPRELADMVRAVREAEEALGSVRYEPTDQEKQSRVFRRSLFVAKDIGAGEIFTPENVRSVRPAHGLHTRYYDDILGKRAARDIAMGTPLAWDMVEGCPRQTR